MTKTTYTLTTKQIEDLIALFARVRGWGDTFAPLADKIEQILQNAEVAL